MNPAPVVPFVPKYGQLLGPEANGILVLEEVILDPVAARKEQHEHDYALWLVPAAVALLGVAAAVALA